MEQVDLARVVVQALEELRIPYMIVGSYGSGAWGEPRFTQDVDVVIELRYEEIEALCAKFPEADFYISSDAARQAVARGGLFNLIHSTSGNKVDFIIPRKDAWSKGQLARRRRVQIPPDLLTYVASPEDIIISKMSWYREGGSEKHLRDITGILKVSGAEVDMAYVKEWAEKLGLTEIWQAILRRLGLKDSGAGTSDRSTKAEQAQ